MTHADCEDDLQVKANFKPFSFTNIIAVFTWTDSDSIKSHLNVIQIFGTNNRQDIISYLDENSNS